MLSSKLIRGPKEEEVIVVGETKIQWVLANDGQVPWPNQTTLRLVGGPVLMRPVVEVPALEPGQTIVLDLYANAPAEPASVFYTLVGPNCQPFGEIVSVQVVPESKAPEPACAVLLSPMRELDAGLEALQGEVKTIEWALANMGPVDWPEDVAATLVYSSPGLEHLPSRVAIPSVQPGMTVHVGVEALMPAQAGCFKAMWKVESPTHPDFGEILHVEFSVGDFPFMDWMAADTAKDSDLPAAQAAAEAPTPCSTEASKPNGRLGLPVHPRRPSPRARFEVRVSNRFAQLAVDAEESLLDAAAPLEPAWEEEPSQRPQPSLPQQRGKGGKEQRRHQVEEECEKMWQEQLAKLAEASAAAKTGVLHDPEQGDDHDLEQGDDEQWPGSAEVEEQEPQPEAATAPPAAQVEAAGLEVGATVEARNGDGQAWERGTVAGLDPLTVIIGDNLMAFEYQQVRTVRFEVGVEVEVRNGNRQKWEPATVASEVPLTVFTRDSAMSFEYKQVRLRSSKDAAKASPFSFLGFILVSALAMLVSAWLAADMVAAPPSTLPENSTALLEGSTWLSQNRTGADQHVGAEGDAVPVQRMRELGHLRLSVSDCAGAEQWFSRAAALVEGAAATTAGGPPDQAVPLSLERTTLLGDLGFALVCGEKFEDGVTALRQALSNETLAANELHLANALGFGRFRLQDYDGAKAAFQAALEANPLNPVLWNNLAAASINAGDETTAKNALQRALYLIEHLAPAMKSHYTQVFSNNVHVLRGDVAGAEPSIEIFYCMPSEVSALVASAGPEELQETFERVMTSVEAEAADARPTLMDARDAVLAMRPEPVFCL